MVQKIARIFFIFSGLCNCCFFERERERKKKSLNMHMKHFEAENTKTVEWKCSEKRVAVSSTKYIQKKPSTGFRIAARLCALMSNEWPVTVTKLQGCITIGTISFPVRVSVSSFELDFVCWFVCVRFFIVIVGRSVAILQNNGLSSPGVYGNESTSMYFLFSFGILVSEHFRCYLSLRVKYIRSPRNSRFFVVRPPTLIMYSGYEFMA